MTINCTHVETTNTTIFTSSGSNAVNLLLFCNTETSLSAKLTVYIVPNGSVLADVNTIIKNAIIPPSETLSFSSEKLILSNGDAVVAKAVRTDNNATVACQATVSSIAL
jgi:hypothetical protein